MSDPRPRLIAVDWGTTRLRASLVDAAGHAAERRDADMGVQSVPAGGFPDALEAVAGEWLSRWPDCPVVMAGMVGSRNGWREVPYVSCPCGPDDLVAGLARVEGLHDVRIVPGVDVRGQDGSYDVMRGEEVQALGSGCADGLVCLPGTHSKWVEMRGGRIVGFATFITGELYAAMCASFVGRLAEEPPDPQAGETAGAAAAQLPGGLSRLLFQARTKVLGGDLPGRAVRPFLSSLVIGAEIAGAAELFGPAARVCLVAAPPQRDIYVAALEARGVGVTVVNPADASLQGLIRVAGAVR